MRSFKQILDEKLHEGSAIKADSAREFTQDPSHLAYLMGQVGRVSFASSRQYPRPATRPQRKPHTLTPAQAQAFAALQSWIFDLSPAFTEGELKKAFRQAAHILHPDHGGQAEQFMELKSHYETLKAVVTK
jgi:hypothetical protein